MNNKDLYVKIKETVIKLDNEFVDSLEECELMGQGIQQLMTFIVNDIFLLKRIGHNDRVVYNIRKIKRKAGYNVDIIKFFDERHGVNINLNFVQSDKYLFAMYKNIYAIDNDGVIIGDLVDDIANDLKRVT